MLDGESMLEPKQKRARILEGGVENVKYRVDDHRDLIRIMVNRIHRSYRRLAHQHFDRHRSHRSDL